MKIKCKFIVSLILVSLFILCIATISNAAIEIKPNTTAHVSITATTAYAYCYDMRYATSTLGVNSLDPHLTLNADWGATVYLGASTYGGIRNVSGNDVTIDGKSYTSTTNNITGVINLKNSFTSSLCNNPSFSTNAENLNKNIGTKYVEKLENPYTIENTKGMAISEVKGWYTTTINQVYANYPILRRGGFFAATVSNGVDATNISYRPVIWN